MFFPPREPLFTRPNDYVVMFRLRLTCIRAWRGEVTQVILTPPAPLYQGLIGNPTGKAAEEGLDIDVVVMWIMECKNECLAFSPA